MTEAPRSAEEADKVGRIRRRNPRKSTADATDREQATGEAVRSVFRTESSKEGKKAKDQGTAMQEAGYLSNMDHRPHSK